jgi:hypothetical protein
MVVKKGRLPFITDEAAAVFPTEMVASGPKNGTLDWPEDHYNIQTKDSQLQECEGKHGLPDPTARSGLAIPARPA